MGGSPGVHGDSGSLSGLGLWLAGAVCGGSRAALHIQSRKNVHDTSAVVGDSQSWHGYKTGGHFRGTLATRSGGSTHHHAEIQHSSKLEAMLVRFHIQERQEWC